MFKEMQKKKGGGASLSSVTSYVSVTNEHQYQSRIQNRKIKDGSGNHFTLL
jgi:hypothetical protein